jgi:hypothetical protein
VFTEWYCIGSKEKFETLYASNIEFSGPGVVAYIYNPSYSGGRDQEDCDLRPVMQKVSETPISTNKLGVVADIYTPAVQKV